MPEATDLSQPKRASFAHAAKWSYAMDGGRQITTTIITFILAGVLGPEAFGVAAMALVYVQFVEMLQNQGMAAALIQRVDLREEHLYSAFWAILGTGLVLTTVSVLVAPWWAGVIGLPGLANVIRVLAFMVPIRALVIVHEALLRRAMDFRTLAIRTNVAAVIAGVVAVTMALMGAGVWAIIAQQLVGVTVGLVLIWTLCPWRPQRRFSRDALMELAGFSVRSFSATVAVFVGNRSDVLLIGLFFGAEAAGLYYFASRMVTMATDLAAKALQGASLPELSRHQRDPEKFGERTMSIIALSALLTFPILAIVAAASNQIVALLGEEWGPTAEVLRLLTLVGAVRAVTLITGPMLQSLGRPGALARLSWASAILSAGTFAVTGFVLTDAALETQVVALALSRVAVHVVFLWMYLRPLRLIVANPWRRIATTVGPVFATCVAGFALGSVTSMVFAPLATMFQLVLVGSVTGLFVAGVLWMIDPKVRGAATSLGLSLKRLFA